MSQPPGGSFFQHLFTDLHKLSTFDSEVDEIDIINKYFNQEKAFFDEYQAQNHHIIWTGALKKTNKDIDINPDPLMEQKNTLLSLDHVLDKYLGVKNIYLHDLVKYIQVYK